MARQITFYFLHLLSTEAPSWWPGRRWERAASPTATLAKSTASPSGSPLAGRSASMTECTWHGPTAASPRSGHVLARPSAAHKIMCYTVDTSTVCLASDVAVLANLTVSGGDVRHQLVPIAQRRSQWWQNGGGIASWGS